MKRWYQAVIVVIWVIFLAGCGLRTPMPAPTDAEPARSSDSITIEGDDENNAPTIAPEPTEDESQHYDDDDGSLTLTS